MNLSYVHGVGTTPLSGALRPDRPLNPAVGRMLTGRGKILNRVGVTPDVVVDLPYQDLVIHQDPQLQAAIKLVQTGL